MTTPDVTAGRDRISGSNTCLPKPATHAEASDAANGSLFNADFRRVLAVQMSFGFCFSAFFLLPEYLTLKLSAGPDAIGRVTASATLAAVLAVPILGGCIDRYDRRFLIVCGTLASSALAIGFCAVQRLGPALLGLRAAQGVAFALVFNVGATLVADLAPPARLGQALGYFGLASLATNAVAPAIGEALASRFGWQAVFAFAATMAALASCFAYRLPKSRAARAQHSERADYPAQIKGVLYAAFVVGIGFGTLFTFSLPFAIARGARHVSAFFLGYTCAATFVRLGLGSIADRIGRPRIAVVALLVYALAAFASMRLEPAALIWLGALLGIAHGFVYPALNAMVVDGVAAPDRGSAMTLFSGGFNAGVALSTLVLGRVAEHFGFEPVFAIAGIASLSAAYVLRRATASPL